jgi:hypothetical protein
LQNREIQSLLPLTVKQITEAFLSSDDKSNFTIDGVDVNNVGFSKLDFAWVFSFDFPIMPGLFEFGICLGYACGNGMQQNWKNY